VPSLAVHGEKGHLGESIEPIKKQRNLKN